MLLEVATRLDRILAQADDLALFGVTCGRLVRLVREALGEELAVYPDGRMLIWDIARHDGYRIPDYPMAGCGDVKEFLRDEGARNVPDWYERHLGIDRETYDSIYRYELVMVRNRALWRRVFLVPSHVMAQTGATSGPLLDAARTWLAFALDHATGADDPRLFTR